MSYPAPRHLGEGTTTATLRLADAEPELAVPFGGSATAAVSQTSYDFQR